VVIYLAKGNRFIEAFNQWSLIMGYAKLIAGLALLLIMYAAMPYPLCAGEVIFEDYFNDNQNRWGTPDTKMWRLAVEDGKYLINNKSTRSSCRTWNKKIDLKDDIDFTIETSIQKTGGLDNRGYGLLWGLKDNKNQYIFETGGNGYFGVFRVENTIVTPIINWKPFKQINRGNSNNKLTVARYKEKTHFFINDAYAGQAQGLFLYGPMVGFGNESNVETAVDYIRIVAGVPEYLLMKIPGYEETAEQIPAEQKTIVPKQEPAQQEIIIEPEAEPEQQIETKPEPEIAFELVAASIEPPTVPPRGKFDIVVEYKLSDPETDADKVSVRMTYTISAEGEILFESSPTEVKSFNHKNTRRIEHVNASARAGKYSAKVHLQYRQKEIVKALDFEIE